ncbi:MAG: extracellular solute-binding protein, partial [Acetatifactor sp.]|nr:extracellular solute-binding protein [Acetatifactor sp.]
EEYLRRNADKQKYNGAPLYFQCERTDQGTLEVRRSSASININYNASDPEIEPYHPYNVVYNTIGGSSWKYSGEAIEWMIDVPKEGLYQLCFKGKQSISRGVTSYRKLKVNGRVPFYEANELKFEYSTKMRNYLPGYYVYLVEGSNVISLEVVLGQFGECYSEVSESVRVLNDLYRQIIRITGTVPDQYVDYEVVKKLPEYVPTIQEERDRLAGVLESLLEITGEKGENSNLVEKILVQLDMLLEEPDKIAVAGELGSFKSNITSLATWLIQISEMPLEMDYIVLCGEEQQPKAATATTFHKWNNNMARFFATFFVDNTQIYMDEEEEQQTAEAVKVWIPSGRDQAQILRRLIDEEFSSKYGIGIDLELVPLDVVLPSTLAGVGPDVILSIDQTKMMDFAMRNALVDLSKLADYEQVSSTYSENILRGVTYQEGVYGLPETENFYMMFYREDILESLGLTAPRTWDEFKSMISVLQMNHYDAYLPESALLTTLLLQNGADLYAGEGNLYGIKSGLSDKVAMETFKELTDFFTAYKLPVSIDFANRFRTGEVPIGIADYTTFNTFELLAPEIKGLWSFAPVPGVENEDGTIYHPVAASTVQCAMLNAAVEHGVTQQAWTFMKWWLSSDVQARYAGQIEALLGSSARYASANREVLQKLPWSSTNLKILLEQFDNTVSIPPVPGHYMTTRMMDYAFKDVVTGGLNPRETLYFNIKEINAELTKKREEFGLVVSEGEENE